MSPPTLHVNGSLTLPIGSMKPLDLPLLNVREGGGRLEDLQFRVVSAPTNGQLVLSRDGQDVQLDKAGHFSWTDVNEHRVRFVHSREKPRWLGVVLFSSCFPSLLWALRTRPHFSVAVPAPLGKIDSPETPALAAARRHFAVIAPRVCFRESAFSLSRNYGWFSDGTGKFLGQLPSIWGPAETKLVLSADGHSGSFSIRAGIPALSSGRKREFAKCSMVPRIPEWEGSGESQLFIIYFMRLIVVNF